MDLLGSIFTFTNQIKVIHNIPGRMRLSISAAKNLPDECKEYENIFSTLLLDVMELNSFDYSYITGRVLITYDTNKTNDKEILEKLKLAIKIIVKNRKQLFNIEPSEVEETMKNVATLIKEDFKKHHI